MKKLILLLVVFSVLVSQCEASIFPFKPSKIRLAPLPPKPDVVKPVDKKDLPKEIPLLHSNPKGKAVLYLDFDGHNEPYWNRYRNVNTPVFTRTDLITEIWERVAEDYAPFDIDVTTELPKNIEHGKFLRASIGGRYTDWLNLQAGGIAEVDCFTNTRTPNVVFVFASNFYDNPKVIADATSHECGHAFGLWHQRCYDDWGRIICEYNPGNGSIWGPIMGNAYKAKLSTWYNGRSWNYQAFQDDMSIIASMKNGFGYKQDDYGNELALAKELIGESVDGIISTHVDKDVFYFEAKDGEYSFQVETPIGANLDSVLLVFDSNGNLIETSSPDDTLNSSLLLKLVKGRYYITVQNTGVYGHVGSYKLKVKING